MCAVAPLVQPRIERVYNLVGGFVTQYVDDRIPRMLQKKLLLQFYAADAPATPLPPPPTQPGND